MQTFVPSPFSRKPFGGINANQLRCLAIFLMLLDHLWAKLIPDNFWMTYLGRLAFPIFAFQISEGFFHTADRKRYAKRLLLFALLSEVPFDLMYGSTVFYPFHQNVMFTLLLGLLAVSAIDRARQTRTAGAALRAALVLLGTLLLAAVGMVDYGWRGVLTVVAFYALRGFPCAWLAQIAAMVLLNIVGFRGLLLPVLGWEIPAQGFAVFALLPIWLYNGRRGRENRALQYGFYAFYPVHMLILSLPSLLR